MAGGGTPLARDEDRTVGRVRPSPATYEVSLQHQYEPLGVELAPGTLQIARVLPGGAAARAGMLPCARITAVNDDEVHTPDELQAAFLYLRTMRRATVFRVAVHHEVPPMNIFGPQRTNAPSPGIANLPRTQPQWRHRSDYGRYDPPPPSAQPPLTVKGVLAKRREAMDPTVDVLVPFGVDMEHLTAGDVARWELMAAEATARRRLLRWYRGWLRTLEREFPAANTALRLSISEAYRTQLHMRMDPYVYGSWWAVAALPRSQVRPFMLLRDEGVDIDGCGGAGAPSPARAASLSPPTGASMNWLNPTFPCGPPSPARQAQQAPAPRPAPWLRDALRTCVVFAAGGVRGHVDYRGWSRQHGD